MLKAQILLAWLVISCGHVLWWRRRDNLFGYLQAGFFFAAAVIPVLGTSVIDDAPRGIARQYADLMVLGAMAYLVGLAAGGRTASAMRLPNFTFAGESTDTPPAVMIYARRLAVGGLAVLTLSFAIMGYAPITAADRVSAKYGVGVYAAGFARGSLFYNAALLITSTVLPVILVLVVRHRRLVDVALAGALFFGLMATLSRTVAFIGPLVFLIALAVDRRWRPWAIVASAGVAYVGGAIFNSLVSLTPLANRPSFAAQVSASTPDVTDHLAFLDGFGRGGRQFVGIRPISAALSLDKSEFNPATYALQVRTGLTDVTGLASGGLRLPASIWGYASYGLTGTVIWCVISGAFIGMGTVILRRALAPAVDNRGNLLKLVLAWVFYEGTFGVLGDFFFIPRVAIIGLGIAVMLGLRRGPSRRTRVVQQQVTQSQAA